MQLNFIKTMNMELESYSLVSFRVQYLV